MICAINYFGERGKDCSNSFKFCCRSLLCLGIYVNVSTVDSEENFDADDVATYDDNCVDEEEEDDEENDECECHNLCASCKLCKTG